MSDPGYMSITINGQPGRVPRDKAAALMRQLDADGVPFDATPGPAGIEGQNLPANSPQDQEGISRQNLPVNSAPQGGPLEQLAALGGMEPGGGRDYQDPRIQQAQMDVAGPSLWQAGKILAPMALPGGQSLGPIARTGLNALEAGGTGAAISGLEDDRWKSDPMAAAYDALVNGGKSAAIGGAVSGALNTVGALSGPLKALGDKARMASMSTPGAIKTNLATNGADYPAQLVQEAERLGIFNNVLPQSPADIAGRAQSVMNSAGPGYMDAIEAAGAQGVTVPRDAIMGQMQGLRGQYAADVGSNGAAQQRVADDLMARFGSGEGEMSPLEAWAAKKNFQDSGGYVSGDLSKLPEGQTPVVNRQFGGAVRSELDRAMGGAAPETQASYELGRQNYEPAADVNALATDRSNVVGSRGMRGFGAGNLADYYGMSAAGNVARGAQGVTDFAGGISDIGRGVAGAGPLGDLPDVAAAQGQQQAQAQRERISNRSMGHNIQSVVEQALDTNPAALGQYAPQLQQAYQSGDPMAITAALYELERDQTFRTTVLQQLQDASNPTGED